MGIIAQIDFVRAGLVLVGAYISYTLWVIYYRLYLHPLAKLKIPGIRDTQDNDGYTVCNITDIIIIGPKLGAATFLYEFYWNIVKEGQYIYQIEKWHRAYGTGHSTIGTFAAIC